MPYFKTGADLTAALSELPASLTGTYRAFDAFFYAGQYMANYSGTLTPIEHFVQIGAARGYMPNADFDPAFYQSQYADLRGLDAADLLFHYVRFGLNEGRAGNATLAAYNWADYLAAYPDVNTYVTANLSSFGGSATNGAIAHFVKFGAQQGFTLPNTFVQSFNLTYGVDTGAAYTGTSGNDTFNAAEPFANNSVWTLGDAIDGGKGNDTFNVIQTAAIALPVGATVANIETANFMSAGTVTLSTATGFSGLTSLTSQSSGGATITAAGTTALVVTDTDAAGTAQAVAVNGGSAVSVTSLNNILDTITVGGTTAATGAVTVTSTGGKANTNTQGAITVTGGTTVTVTQNAGNAGATGVDTVGGAISVTGNASTTAVTVNQTKSATGADATATAAAVVGYTAGGVTIADKNAASTTAAGTITTVTLNSFGDKAGPAVSTINSGALTTINLSGNAIGAGLTVTNGNLTTPAVTTQALNLNGFTTGAGAGVITLDTDITTLNIASSTAASTIKSLVAAGATTVNISGDAALTLTGQTFTAATAVNVTNSGATILGTALGAGVTFTGGTGAETITLTDGFTKASTLGDGNDSVGIVDTNGDGVLASTATGLVGSVNAGNGDDTVRLSDVTAAAVSLNAAFNTAFTGFEILDVTDATTNADATVNLAGINGVNKVVARATTINADANDQITLNGYATGGTLTLDTAGTGYAFVANVTNAALSATDSFNLVLTNAGQTAFGTVTAAGVETMNISLVDTGTAAATTDAATIQTVTLGANTSLKSLVVSGNNGLTITNSTTSTAITSFDASGVVGNTANDTAANLAVTFASSNSTTTASVTLIGGAGNDTLTGNAAKDTITGGAGGDIVNGGMGQDTINVGTGHDVIQIISDIDATAGKGVQSTTSAPDVVNGFVLASAITTAVDLSSATNFIAAATAGGANTSMLSIDLNKDDAGAGAGTNVAVSIEANVTTATAAQAVGTTYTVSKGILTLGGSGASAVDTLAEWLVEANAVAATDGETIAFVYGGDTYVFAQNGATGDTLVQLVGVAATSLVLASATTTATAGAVIIGDSL